jgi:hypothetical protein
MRSLAVDYQQGISDAWARVATFVPKLVGALLILLIGWLVARLLATLLDRVLDRVGFDRAVERGGLRQALARSKYDPSDILAKLVFWAVILITLQLAFGVFGPNPVSDLLSGIIGYLPNVFVAILILVIAGALAKAARDLLDSVLGGVAYGRALAVGAGVAILVIGGFAALDQLRIAPDIVRGLWYALLAIVVGSAVIAFGVGGIPIARDYLQRAARSAELRAPEVRARVERERARRDARDQASQYTEVPPTPAAAPPPPRPDEPDPGPRRTR